MLTFIWVPGTEQPPELAGKRRATVQDGGSDYHFDSLQEAFDAADVLRARRQPYDLQMHSRWPWGSGRHRMISGCFV